MPSPTVVSPGSSATLVPGRCLTITPQATDQCCTSITPLVHRRRTDLAPSSHQHQQHHKQHKQQQQQQQRRRRRRRRRGRRARFLCTSPLHRWPPRFATWYAIGRASRHSRCPVYLGSRRRRRRSVLAGLRSHRQRTKETRESVRVASDELRVAKLAGDGRGDKADRNAAGRM